MITRRSITKSLAAGAGLLGFLGLKAQADAPKANRRHKPIPPHERPTMEMLANIVELDGGEKAKYYRKVFQKALVLTGPVYWSLLESRSKTFFPATVGFWECAGPIGVRTRSSFAVLIPDEILPNIRYAERGEGFPRDVPFVELH